MVVTYILLEKRVFFPHLQVFVKDNFKHELRDFAIEFAVRSLFCTVLQLEIRLDMCSFYAYSIPNFCCSHLLEIYIY